jgi:hypothetical protein
MRYPAKQNMEMVAMEPRTIPAMLPPDRALFGEPVDGDVLSRAPSGGAVERDVPVGSVPEVLAVLAALVVLVVPDARDIDIELV